MLEYLAKDKKDIFITSGEVDSAKWVPLPQALENLREGGIAWQLVKEILEQGCEKTVSVTAAASADNNRTNGNADASSIYLQTNIIPNASGPIWVPMVEPICILFSMGKFSLARRSSNFSQLSVP